MLNFVRNKKVKIKITNHYFSPTRLTKIRNSDSQVLVKL